MKRSDLDRAFAQTPEAFSARIDQTLRMLKEERPVKKITARAVLAAALIVILASGIAYAVISLGQEWYFNNRFTAYQEHEPQKHQAIMDNLQKDIAQENTGNAAELTAFKVLDASWAQAEKVFTLSLSASPLNPGDELHGYGDLDPDGSWVVALDPDDPDTRTDHWLWTEKGFGLPQDTMTDPSKRLLLLDVWDEVYIGSSQVPLPMWMSDHFTIPEGPVMVMMEFDLGLMEDEEINKIFAEASVPEGMDKAVFEKNQQEQQTRLLNLARDRREAVDQHTDQAGYLSLRFPYRLWPFDLAANALGEAVEGELHFSVKIR